MGTITMNQATKGNCLQVAVGYVSAGGIRP